MLGAGAAQAEDGVAERFGAASSLGAARGG